MHNDSYDLAELSDLADVTPRTVRYYVQQGLLPSPGARGLGARYDRGHLDRLQLIKRLQREHLPLAEIRARLAALSDAEVGALLEEPDRAGRHGSALAYVQDVLAGRPPRRAPNTPPRRSTAAPQSSAESLRCLREEPSGYDPAAPADGAPMRAAPDEDAGGAAAHEPPGPARSTWERVALAPDVELHVRRPLSRAQNKLVDRLIEHARTLFTDHS